MRSRKSDEPVEGVLVAPEDLGVHGRRSGRSECADGDVDLLAEEVVAGIARNVVAVTAASTQSP